jgi:hypothetical protein
MDAHKQRLGPSALPIFGFRDFQAIDRNIISRHLPLGTDGLDCCF